VLQIWSDYKVPLLLLIFVILAYWASKIFKSKHTQVKHVISIPNDSITSQKSKKIDSVYYRRLDSVVGLIPSEKQKYLNEHINK
jgi:uncharacterized membrane protein